jgi:hypothetical protein
LATIDRDGSPHLTGVGALWVNNAFWFETGDGTRKAKNLARDPRCTLSVATARRRLGFGAHGRVQRTVRRRGSSTASCPARRTAFLTVEPSAATRWRF